MKELAFFNDTGLVNYLYENEYTLVCNRYTKQKILSCAKKMNKKIKPCISYEDFIFKKYKREKINSFVIYDVEFFINTISDVQVEEFVTIFKRGFI